MAGFCATYPRFLETAETAPIRNRLDTRHKAIIEWNCAHLANKRILDLACHDGRWSFAALAAGARHALGIEARGHLVEKARENFAFYGVPTDRYEFRQGTVGQSLRALPDACVDVTMCLGFLYHSHEHHSLLLECARVSTEVLILDTEVSDVAGTAVLFREELITDSRNSVDYSGSGRNKVLVGTPSKSALLLMLDYAGFTVEEFDWSQQGIGDWTGIVDYRDRRRITLRCTRRAHCS